MAGDVAKFSFPSFPGTIRGPQLLEFLRHLLRHIRASLWAVLDGLWSHRSWLVGILSWKSKDGL